MRTYRLALPLASSVLTTKGTFSRFYLCAADFLKDADGVVFGDVFPVGVGHCRPGFADAVVIDEVHHAMAPTYRRLLDHQQPQQLQGLTATPRGVMASTSQNSSSTAAARPELRHWDAPGYLQLCWFRCSVGIAAAERLSATPEGYSLEGSGMSVGHEGLGGSGASS